MENGNWENRYGGIMKIYFLLIIAWLSVGYLAFQALAFARISQFSIFPISKPRQLLFFFCRSFFLPLQMPVKTTAQTVHDAGKKSDHHGESPVLGVFHDKKVSGDAGAENSKDHPDVFSDAEIFFHFKVFMVVLAAMCFNCAMHYFAKFVIVLNPRPFITQDRPLN